MPQIEAHNYVHGFALSNEKQAIVLVFIRFLAKTAFESLKGKLTQVSMRS